MEQRISLITLGVSDIGRSRAFYEALGWHSGTDPGAEDEGGPAFFQAGGMVFAVWDRAKLAGDSEVTDDDGWGGMTLAHCVRSQEEVGTVIEQARAAGATVGREPGETFWGGYDGIFIDPDGHPWEVAYNPRWVIGEDGSVTLPE
jgi:predicted lactoylglutathione lyase